MRIMVTVGASTHSPNKTIINNKLTHREDEKFGKKLVSFLLLEPNQPSTSYLTMEIILSRTIYIKRECQCSVLLGNIFLKSV